MADEKISQLTSGNPAQSADLVPIARNVSGTETNFSVTAGSIASLGGGSSTVSVNGTPVSNPNFVAGTNVTLPVTGSNVTINASGSGGSGISSIQYGPNTALTGAVIESFGLGMATPSQSGNTVTVSCNSATTTVIGCSTLPIPISYFTTSYNGADLCIRIQQALTAAGNDNATIDARGEVGTQSCSVNPFANLSGSVGIDVYLPPYPITLNSSGSAWIANANDLHIHGYGITGTSTRLNAGSSFPASTPMLTLGSTSNQSEGLTVDNISVNCGAGPSTCLPIFIGNIQEFCGLYHVGVDGANSASLTGPCIELTNSPGHYTLQDVSVGSCGANHGIQLLSAGTNGGWFERITCNNTGKVQGLDCIAFQSNGSANTVNYFHGIHAEGFNNTVHFGAHTGGTANDIDSTGVNTTVLQIDSGALTVYSESIYGSGTNVVNDLSVTPNNTLTVTNNAKGLGSYTNQTITANVADVGSLLLNTYIVSALPSASALGAGAVVIVTDALTAGIGGCVGGGSNIMLAVSSGSVWSCH